MTCILLHRPHDVFMIFLSPIFLQHGRSDSYRVATLPNIRDDNKTADGMYKVYSQRCRHYVHARFLHNLYFRVWIWASSLGQRTGNVSLALVLSLYLFPVPSLCLLCLFVFLSLSLFSLCVYLFISIYCRFVYADLCNSIVSLMR